MPRKYIQLLTSITILCSVCKLLIRRRPSPRLSRVSHSSERVLVLGATSGIGRAIAHQYAQRGARVCLVGRRQVLLDEVVRECNRDSVIGADSVKCFGVRGDFANVEDMVRVRAAVEEAWGGLDTMIVAAGVSALQPLMTVALGAGQTESLPPQASAAGIQRTADVAAAATAGNYVGPLIAAVTFIPLLSCSSPSPSILLLSSIGSIVPAPTRTLYGSTKTASLLLYQSLSIEHPNIRFSFVLPGTVEGDFRAGAVDADMGGGGVKLWETDPNSKIGGGLDRAVVARECIRSVDLGVRHAFMPGYVRFAHVFYWIWPSLIERLARAKYNFPAPQ